MGWSYGVPARSAAQLDSLVRQVGSVLPARQWCKVLALFDLAARNGGPFVFAAADAYRIAQAFRDAAAHPAMPAAQSRLARDVAADVVDATRTGTPWRWS